MNSIPNSPGGLSLGAYLRSARAASGLTLRAVEGLTGSVVKNAYLSQIEGDSIQQPSPNVLFHLANAYELDYADLLLRAGHKVPGEAREPVLNGIPLRALEGLTDDESAELMNYIAYMRSRNKRE